VVSGQCLASGGKFAARVGQLVAGFGQCWPVLASVWPAFGQRLASGDAVVVE
jgi:hypothetical protein